MGVGDEGTDLGGHEDEMRARKRIAMAVGIGTRMTA